MYSTMDAGERGNKGSIHWDEEGTEIICMERSKEAISEALAQLFFSSFPPVSAGHWIVLGTHRLSFSPCCKVQESGCAVN